MRDKPKDKMRRPGRDKDTSPEGKHTSRASEDDKAKPKRGRKAVKDG